MNSAERLLRKISRINKTATKYKFSFIPKQLIIETNEKWCPDQIFLVCEHNGRRISSKPRRLESSCNIACRRLVVWPDIMKDSIEFETTLYSKDTKETLDDKKWTLVLEGTMTKARNGRLKIQHKSLAAYEFNINNLISPSGQKAEILLRFRPLIKEVITCSLEMDVLTLRELITSTPCTPKSIHVLQTTSCEAVLETRNNALITESDKNIDFEPTNLPSQTNDFGPTNLPSQTNDIETTPPNFSLLFNAKSNCNNTPRLFNTPSDCKSPDQAEVKALIAQLITSKRPELKSTPRSKEKIAKEDISTQNADKDQKHGVLSNSFIEKAREMQKELQQIAQQIQEIEQQDYFVLEKIPDFDNNSKEERELIEHHTRLVGEKDQLSRRQDFLNVQLELNETEFKISQIRSLLAINGDADEEQNEEKVDGPIASILQFDQRRDSNALLLELKELVDHKDILTHQLSDMEAEDEEGLEMNRLTLERTRQHFLMRGPQEPFNMSRRLMNWLGGQNATE